MKIIYEQYFIKLDNQSHKSKQVVFQIWGWYLKKWDFSKILFGSSTNFSPLDASKTQLVHTVLDLWFTVEFLSQILQEHTCTQTHFFMTHLQTTLWHL